MDTSNGGTDRSLYLGCAAWHWCCIDSTNLSEYDQNSTWNYYTNCDDVEGVRTKYLWWNCSDLLITHLDRVNNPNDTNTFIKYPTAALNISFCLLPDDNEESKEIYNLYAVCNQSLGY